MQPLLVQLVPVAPCLLHLAPCEGKASVLFVAALSVLEYSGDIPPKTCVLQGEKT